MSIPSILFTNKGRILQAKAQTGTSLHFTRIAIGDGELQGQAPQTFTTLVNEKLSVEITKLVTDIDGTAKVGGSFNNSNLANGFYYRELGLFARDPDDSTKEILYVYGNGGALAEYVPPQGSELIEKKIDIIAMIGNAPNVSATINSSLIGLGPEDLEAHEKDQNAHKPIRDWVQRLMDGINHTWEGITGKPTEFPPEQHAHDDLYYTKLESDTSLSSHNSSQQAHPFLAEQIKICDGKIEEVKQELANIDVSWEGITSKPTTFPPSGHSHSYSELTGKPTSFPPSSHVHTISDVTGLQGALDGKAPTHTHPYAPASHTHTIANVTGLQGEIDSLKQSVSSGKNAIASAITAKGVAASGSDTHATLANKIGQIPSVKLVSTTTIQSVASWSGSRTNFNGITFPSADAGHLVVFKVEYVSGTACDVELRNTNTNVIIQDESFGPYSKVHYYYYNTSIATPAQLVFSGYRYPTPSSTGTYRFTCYVYEILPLFN